MPNFFSSFRYFLIIPILTFFLYPKHLLGGLIINVSPEISIANVSNINPVNGNLEVIINKQKYIIKLPEASLEAIAVWANDKSNGPFVFSVDGALVPGAGNYMSPSLPKTLGWAMLDYDVYAHGIALGSIPTNEFSHPLIKRLGKAYLPSEQYNSLLDPDNKSDRALWYRKLTSKFTSKPSTIGELTVKVLPSKKGLPVQLAIVSNRWFEASEWYRDVDVASPWDHKAFGIPYEPLKYDMEANWDEYRKAFEPLEELSSIVEAYAILKACLNQKPQLWNQFIDKLAKKRTRFNIADNFYPSYSPKLYAPTQSYPTRSWQEWSIMNLTDGIETTSEADLALALICRKSYSSCVNCEYHIASAATKVWISQIEEFAQSSPRLKAKLLLYQIMTASNSSQRESYAREFFAITGSSPVYFRLRASGWNIINCKLSSTEEINSMLLTEREDILEDFISEVNQSCSSSSDSSLLLWENLLQNVYSTNLIEIAEKQYGSYLKESFVEALACIHSHRGMAFQRGLALTYQHANFRFLSYLAYYYDYGSSGLNYINASGKKILNNIDANLPLQPKRQLGIEMNSLTQPNHNNRLQTIEGTLAFSDHWVNRKKKGKTEKSIAHGGIVRDKKFTMILVGNDLYAQLYSLAEKGEVKITGILHHNGRSITPLKIQYMHANRWQTFDLPHSGISGPGVLGGDE